MIRPQSRSRIRCAPLPLRLASLLAALPIAALLLCVGLLWPARADAQRAPVPSDSARRDSLATGDSLAARLARAEAAIALLQQQLAIEATTVVRTRSRLQLELSGRVLTNSYLTTGRGNSAELPLFVREPLTTAPGANGRPDARAFGVSLRQTFIGAALSVDSVLGGTFVADIDVDFFAGGTAATAEPFAFPQVRLRTVNAQLQWSRTALMVGSETPLISDLNPVSLAAAGTPGFALAGNLWNWIPQLRVSQTVVRRVVGSTPVSFQLHGAALAPSVGVRHLGEPDAIDAGERAARPAMQARASLQWGAADAAEDARGEVGLGVHRGWMRIAGDSTTATRAIAADARVGLTHGISLLAEGYAGRGIASLGGGGIGQTFGTAVGGAPFGAPIRDMAGWLQLNAQLRPTVLSGGGCGLAVANARDLPRRLRNGSCEAHVIWRPTQPVLVGVEVRRIGTVYSSGVERVTHLNLALGFEW